MINLELNHVINLISLGKYIQYYFSNIVFSQFALLRQGKYIGRFDYIKVLWLLYC